MKVYILCSIENWGGGGKPISVHRSEEGAYLKKSDPKFMEENHLSQSDLDEMNIIEFEVED